MEADKGAIELEHAFGYSGWLPRSAFLHPNKTDCIYIVGACVVICDLNDSHNQKFLRGHDDYITCLTVSPSGNFIASGQRGQNADVIIWDFQTAQEKFRLSEHDVGVQCLEFSHDDKLLISCGVPQDGKMYVWDTYTGNIVSSTQLVPSPCVCVKFGGFLKDIKFRPTDRYQFATSGNKKLILWALNPLTGSLDNETLQTGTTVRDYICLHFSPPNERFLFAGTSSGDFCVFFLKTKALIIVHSACSVGVTSIRSLNDQFVICGGGDGQLLSFQLIEGQPPREEQTLKLPGSIMALDSSADQVELLVGTSTGSLFRIRSEDFQGMLLSQNHTQPMTHISFPYGVSDKFASGSEDGTIKIWDLSDYKVISQCIGAGTPSVFVLTLEVVIAGYEDGKLRAFRADTGQQIWQIDNAHRGGVTSLILSHNQRFICSGGFEGEIRIWELKTKDMIAHLKEHTAKVTKLQLFEDDIHLLSTSRDKCMLTWDLRADKRIAAHAARMGGINNFVILPDQNKVVTTGQDRQISLWDLRQSEPLKQIESGPGKEGDELFCLSISPQTGKYMASGGEKSIVRIWDIASMKILAEGHGHSAPIVSIAFSYDEKQVISVGRDSTMMLWNVFL